MYKVSENYATVKNGLFKEDKNLKKEYVALAHRYKLISKTIEARLKKDECAKKK